MTHSIRSVFVLTCWGGSWAGGYTEVFKTFTGAVRYSGIKTPWRKHGDKWLHDGNQYSYKIRKLRLRA